MIRVGRTYEMTALEEFKKMGGQFDLVPLVLSVDPGKETPLSLYRKLAAEGSHSFLLESGDRRRSGGCYSFIGVAPERIFRVTPEGCEVLDGKGDRLELFSSGDGLRRALDGYLACRRPPSDGQLPPFTGGVAGYMGYGMVEEFEDLFHDSKRSLRPASVPKSVLMGFLTVVAFDHDAGRLLLIDNVRIPEESSAEDLENFYREGCGKLERIAELVELPQPKESGSSSFSLSEARSHTSEDEFLEMVHRGREHIVAGNVCQVVLSQRFSAETDLPSLDIYEALRKCNPSPYLFFLDLPDLQLIGSSPEVLVKLEGDRITNRPLAGTRRRGISEAEDLALAEELLADEKERAEHLMLVDLARNDLGRVCRTGSVTVTELMGLEHYSQVMHIVSQVEGKRRKEFNALDVLGSAFPAGTVSGAPKIRAMEIIEDLEKEARGPYAGAVGYIGFDGNMDTCIAIRTLIRQGNSVSVQAGAGIVYDSIPEREYEETRNKARALFRALEAALERRNAR